MPKRKISVEDKLYAVNLYLDGKESQRRIASMFDVSTASVQQWIRNYESMGADAFTLKGNKKSSGTGGSFIMTKGRKTTFDERVEIVQYCIAHNHNYAETAKNIRYLISRSVITLLNMNPAE
ncbi:MAG: helix-turn-helix domain-containing protein [Lachnospiraceae bacterium]